MAMDMNDINEFQTYLQMYDKGLVSKKTVLAKIGIKWEDEQKEIEKDIEFDKQRFNFGSLTTGCCGGDGGREHA